ncbi:MAG: glycosyltransferase [Verrucomicrobiota bacterium]|nr:glycosyltransferase [Verrucomicrobiota bacterium]
MRSISVSTITPVYCGEQYLQELAGELAKVRREWEECHTPFRLVESILVNDAAIDSSPAMLESLAQEYPWIRVLTLSRNFGQHPATISGILHSTGDWVITLDEDYSMNPGF